MRILNILIGLIGLVSIISNAHAGRRSYSFTYDTETLNQGDFELEEWLWGKANPPGGKATSFWLTFLPVYGLTRNIEVAFPWEIVATPTSTTIADFYADARIRLFDRNERRFVQPLLRLFYQFNLNNPHNLGRPLVPWLGGNAVVSFGDDRASHATIDAGYYGDSALAQQKLRYHTLGVGYTHAVTEKELRVGAEYYHEISLNKQFDPGHRYFVGPNVAFSRGQLWMTLGVLFGLNEQAPDTQPRFMFGVSI